MPHELFRGSDVGVERGDDILGGLIAPERLSDRPDQLAGTLDGVLVGQQEDGDARVAKLRQHIRRSGFLAPDDQCRVRREDGLGSERSVVAQHGLLGQCLGRKVAGCVDGHDLVLCPERVRDLGDDTTEGRHAGGVVDHDLGAVGIGDLDRSLGGRSHRCEAHQHGHTERERRGGCAGDHVSSSARI